MVEQFQRFENIAYGADIERANLLDILLPVGVKNPPLTIHFHGGGWQQFGKYLPDCEFLASAGFAVISANYHYAQEALFPAQYEDVQAVVRWAKNHSLEYGWDASRVGVWGISAGAHLAALLGSNRAAALETESSSQVQAVVCICPPTDLTNAIDWKFTYAHEDGFSNLLGAHAALRPDLAKAASPVYAISSAAAPFLIIHGDQDELVPVHQAQVLHDTLERHGVKSKLEIVAGGSHFINETHRGLWQDLTEQFFRRTLA
jgi:acetyl esterase/lipase